MTINAFTCNRIGDTVDGLRDGLSHFSGPSRAAVIFAMESESPMFIFDPQNLLADHEPRLKELYVENQTWRNHPLIQRNNLKYSEIILEKNLQMTGLISFVGRSGSVNYQMWFTEHHPAMCSTGPTERWLEHAMWRFSHDMASESTFHTGISGSFLREYATHAVRDDVVDRMNVICLLDGRAIVGQDRACGARYNSALRFTVEGTDIVVVVVSSDRPVAVIQSGVEISAACQWEPVSWRIVKPILLDQWVDRNGD